MIYDRITFKEEMRGLVGIYPSDNPDYPTISPTLQNSDSGYYVNQVNELITVENFNQALKNYSTFNYTAYSSSTEYEKGDKVTDSSINYEYINDTPSTGNPVTDTTYWREIDNTSDKLFKLYDSAIDMAFNDLFNKKKIKTRVKSLYSNFPLFTGIAPKQNLETNEDKFVGLRIRMRRGEKSILTIINKISTHFTEAVNVPLYVYHSSQVDTVFDTTLNHTKANSSQWHTVSDFNIRYLSDDYDAGGDFYIGYKQSDLGTAQAYYYDIYWNKTPASCCDEWVKYYKGYSKYIDVVAFEMDESDLVSGELIDEENITYVYDRNYGLNINSSTRCDIGYFLVDEKLLFAEAVNYAWGLKILETMALTTRQENQTADKNQKAAIGQIYTFANNPNAVKENARYMYNQAIKGVSFDISNLNESCLPCDDDTEFYVKTSGF